MQVEDPRIIEFDVRTDEMLVNMGPQHPSTHGVLRLLLRTDGEVVHEVTPHIGYLHRCAEKIGENLNPQQWVPYTDRMDYLAAMNMNLGWSLTVEKLVGMEVPEKAMVVREIILDLFEEVCGARLTYSYHVPGGSTHDLPTTIHLPPGLAALTGRSAKS